MEFAANYHCSSSDVVSIDGFDCCIDFWFQNCSASNVKQSFCFLDLPSRSNYVGKYGFVSLFNNDIAYWYVKICSQRSTTVV